MEKGSTERAKEEEFYVFRDRTKKGGDQCDKKEGDWLHQRFPRKGDLLSKKKRSSQPVLAKLMARGEPGGGPTKNLHCPQGGGASNRREKRRFLIEKKVFSGLGGGKLVQGKKKKKKRGGQLKGGGGPRARGKKTSTSLKGLLISRRRGQSAKREKKNGYRYRL